jgi:hypothetical protein
MYSFRFFRYEKSGKDKATKLNLDDDKKQKVGEDAEASRQATNGADQSETQDKPSSI